MENSTKIIIGAVVIIAGVIIYMKYFKNKFPSNPKEGDTFTIDGVKYVYLLGNWTKFVGPSDLPNGTGKRVVQYHANPI